MNRHTERVWSDYAILYIVFLVFFFFTCEESITHDIFNPRGNMPRLDSCWFMTAGRAWMNGLTPYVDFTDSKGPLLWLIFGIAYLISPTDYLGVFAIAAVVYLVTMTYILKTFRLFVADRRASLVLTILTIPLLFLPRIHIETRAEDFALAFIITGYYYVCKLLYHSHSTPSDYRRTALALGVCSGATMLIKYSTTVLFLIPMACALFHTWRKRQGALPFVLRTAIGALLVLLPVAGYFIHKGAFMVFVNEYFLITFRTIETIKDEHSETGNVLTFLPATVFVIALAVSTLSAALWLKRYRLFPFAAFASFLLPHIFFSRLYYFNACHGFLIFGMTSIYLLLHYRRQVSRLQLASGIILAAATLVPYLHQDACYTQGYFYHPTRRRLAYQYAEQLLPSHKPTIAYWHCFDVGFGLLSEALPYCKYYAQQNGSTPQMKAEQDMEVMRGKADYVVIVKYNEPLARLLLQMGYKPCKPVNERYQIYRR